jgi:hypothetical protein
VLCASIGIPETNAIGGGMENTAQGQAAVISGGNKNSATGTFGAWVGGGFSNTSSGSSTSLLGGNGRALGRLGHGQRERGRTHRVRSVNALTDTSPPLVRMRRPSMPPAALFRIGATGSSPLLMLRSHC